MASLDQQRHHDDYNDLENFTKYWRNWVKFFCSVFAPKFLRLLRSKAVEHGKFKRPLFHFQIFETVAFLGLYQIWYKIIFKSDL